MPAQADSITLLPVSPDAPEASALIAELDAYLGPLYPAESQHGLSVRRLIDEKVAFFILRVDGKPAGCGGIKFYGEEYAEVKRVYVRPKFRGRGLSRRIMDHLEQIVKARGLRILRLETGVHQPEAIGLYEKLGFRRIGPFGEYQAHPLNLFFEKELE
jgi:putative acetyltransferase